jgi:hypothetical protein
MAYPASLHTWMPSHIATWKRAVHKEYGVYIPFIWFVGESELCKQSIYAAGSIAIGAAIQTRPTLCVSFSEPHWKERKWNNIGFSFCSHVRRPAHLIARHWYLLANWRPFIRWSSEQWVSQCYVIECDRSFYCSLFLYLYVNVQSTCSLNIIYMLALASLTGGDRSIGIVRLRTKNHGVFYIYLYIYIYILHASCCVLYITILIVSIDTTVFFKQINTSTTILAFMYCV